MQITIEMPGFVQKHLKAYVEEQRRFNMCLECGLTQTFKRYCDQFPDGELPDPEVGCICDWLGKIVEQMERDQ